MSHQSPVTSHQIRKYQNLKVWQKATDIALEVYALTKAFPKDEVYALTSQLRRAAVSVASNIAEGSERKSDREFVRFLRIAAASLAEIETQAYIALKLGYIVQESYDTLLEASAENGKMLNGLVSKLEEKSSGDWRLATGD
jgi:four helix bundle protein